MARNPNPPKSPKSAAESADEEIIDPAEAALIREVDEELRRERMLAFWKRYGGWISGLALCLALVAAGFKGYQYIEHKRTLAAVRAYEEALVKLELGDTSGALGEFSEITREYPGAVAALAGLSEAAIALDQGRVSDAVDLYRRIAADKAAAPPFRDLARILAVSNGLDTLSRAEVEEILAPLRSPRHNFQPLADELAAYAALKDGDRAAAEALFTAVLGNSQTGEQGRERVRGVMMSLGLGLARPGAQDGPSAAPAGNGSPSDTSGGENSDADDGN
ncbi:tetratricopeptide repeat protein [Phaeovibrio sulfidiphilus]|uniref:Tetratricopeptide repeat protein n=1 Tax=Phaeovibrio sulfidiphilus TaxID=1220600 RepID=A0A8J6YW68_9PROT|nr:tetratricopeptide repeat protein [Phaeovibrio sulfidiphilus]MBE1236822.1 tetratricopeptide repeat protein [Phaeovibrio sulfidiphilus]